IKFKIRDKTEEMILLGDKYKFYIVRNYIHSEQCIFVLNELPSIQIYLHVFFLLEIQFLFLKRFISLMAVDECNHTNGYNRIVFEKKMKITLLCLFITISIFLVHLSTFRLIVSYGCKLGLFALLFGRFYKYLLGVLYSKNKKRETKIENDNYPTTHFNIHIIKRTNNNLNKERKKIKDIYTAS
ncbi:hypothetical protein ACJX0J_037247, partial [Zea mays]